ncbi:hypothetical protein HPULCUR_004716 [Helicostylum pulchrum]|uniref:Uncharacterized protein n=1 Tax=Helicostylum pulchrum TaxID=562976 RepID=A0ABP9XX06_9FUNG
MSYFTTIRCNDWDLEEALNPYLTDSEDENEAYRKLKRQLLDLCNYIDNNGKRVNDIFNTPGGENTDFVNKLLKTTIPNQENEDFYDLQDLEGEEQLREQLQENVIFAEEGTNSGLSCNCD